MLPVGYLQNEGVDTRHEGEIINYVVSLHAVLKLPIG